MHEAQSHELKEVVWVHQVDEALLSRVVQRITSAVDPERIVLFGSQAEGTAGEGSDLDILVVMKSDLPRARRAAVVYKALAGLLIPKDVVVYTPEEVEAWKDVPEAFVTTALRRGRVLYERQ